jgi:adenylate kinase
LARKHGIVDDSSNAIDVDTRALRREFARLLKTPALVYGHLLPYVFPPKAMGKVIVLRCEPSVLRGRLEARGYATDKIIANVEAELIGLIASDAYKSFGLRKTFEVDSTHATPRVTAGLAFAALHGKGRHHTRIEWAGSYDSGPKLRSLILGRGKHQA